MIVYRGDALDLGSLDSAVLSVPSPTPQLHWRVCPSAAQMCCGVNICKISGISKIVCGIKWNYMNSK